MILGKAITSAVVASAIFSGCAAPAVREANYEQSLQAASAGYTGCQPADNVLTNVSMSGLANFGTWNATCKAKTYLCAMAFIGTTRTFSCAPAQ